MLEAPVNSRQPPQAIVSELTRRIESSTSFPMVASVDLDVDAYDWLERQTDPVKLVWGDRGSASTTMGLGVARRLTTGPGEGAAVMLSRCRSLLTNLPQQRLFGGFAFRRDGVWENSPWQSFGAASFWLPRATLAGQRLQVVVMSIEDVPSAVQFVERLVDASHAEDAWQLPAWIRRTDRPDREEWTECVAKATRLFDDEVLEKVVLARQVDLYFERPLSPISVLRRLAPAAPACYHFCFQTSPQVGFIGATPERLFWRRGRQVSSEVIAGTRPRGSDLQEDQRLGDELLASAKDQLEHDIVRKSIRQRLHACVKRMEVDAKASLLTLATRQHLFSRVTAQILDGVSDGALIDRLHPTPAVGGYPTENALDEIQRLEPFDRGWYAAPVGWVGVDQAEFAVAIRSGLIHSDRLTLYSGAGIVPGSTADAEWDEIEQKISDFLQLLTPAAGATDVAPR